MPPLHPWPPSQRARPAPFRAVGGFAIAVAVALAGAAAVRPAVADDRALDVWAVSSRGCGDPLRQVQHFGAAGCWRPAVAAELFDGAPRALVLLVHGNRYEHADALDQALRLARWLDCCGGEGDRRRVVAYSWPSDKQGAPLRDSRRKYERAAQEAQRFAGVLAAIEPERPVGIVGYSYGALVALGGIAARVAADGGGGAGPWSNRPGAVHLSLVAAAVRCDALAPRGPYRDAAATVDRVVLLNNSADIALKFFPWVDRGLETDALGRVGMPGWWLPEGVEFRQYDVADIVGRSHRFLDYLESASLARRLCAGLADGLHSE